MSHTIIGIWGLGIVGQSALRFFTARGTRLAVMNSRPPSGDIATFFDEHNIQFFDEQHAEKFFTLCTQILVSPGIDVRTHPHMHHKMVTELDILQQHNTKPVIAITGTVGKTTVTNLLTGALQQLGMHAVMGGNVGVGMLDLVDQQSVYDVAVLELSSFQLEFVKTFAPDLSIITNVFENHLDRHGSMHEYVQAKLQIIHHQRANQQALINYSLLSDVRSQKPSCQINWLCDTPPTHAQLATVQQNERIYFLRNNKVHVYCNGVTELLCDVSTLPPITFAANWLTIVAAMHLLEKPRDHLSRITMPAQHHRLEHVAEIAHVDFYNDSKSTIAQATQAAVDTLQPRPIILLAGGLSKGVDRTQMIAHLTDRVKHVVCFGAEKKQLAAWCAQYRISHSTAHTLHQAFTDSVARACAGDVILLSPGGTSFDLFDNYQQRGDVFKKLVMNLAQERTRDSRAPTTHL